MHYNIRLNGVEYVTLTEPPPLEDEITKTELIATASGGKVRSVDYGGGAVRRRGYRLYLDATDEALWDAFITSLSNYTVPFLLDDHNADIIPMWFVAPPGKVRYKSGNKYVDIEMVEDVESDIYPTTTTT